jgi:hypothetical protein
LFPITCNGQKKHILVHLTVAIIPLREPKIDSTEINFFLTRNQDSSERPHNQNLRPNSPTNGRNSANNPHPQAGTNEQSRNPTRKGIGSITNIGENGAILKYCSTDFFGLVTSPKFMLNAKIANYFCNANWNDISITRA